MVNSFRFINHLVIKIRELREIRKKSPIDILCLDETKLDGSYPDSQFKIGGFQYPPFQRDRNRQEEVRWFL